MTHHQRPARGFTLPELVVTLLLLGVAAAAFIIVPRVGVDRGDDLQAASAIDGTLTTATSVWQVRGELPADTAATPGDPSPLQLALQDANPRLAYLGPETAVGGSQIATHVSVAAIPGHSGAIGAAARSATGRCLLTRYELGDGATPQRFGVIPPDASISITGCSGATALLLNGSSAPAGAGGVGSVQGQGDRDGGSWDTALVIACPDPTPTPADSPGGASDACLGIGRLPTG